MPDKYKFYWSGYLTVYTNISEIMQDLKKHISSTEKSLEESQLTEKMAADLLREIYTKGSTFKEAIEKVKNTYIENPIFNANTRDNISKNLDILLEVEGSGFDFAKEFNELDVPEEIKIRLFKILIRAGDYKIDELARFFADYPNSSGFLKRISGKHFFPSSSCRQSLIRQWIDFVWQKLNEFNFEESAVSNYLQRFSHTDFLVLEKYFDDIALLAVLDEGSAKNVALLKKVCKELCDLQANSIDKAIGRDPASIVAELLGLANSATSGPYSEGFKTSESMM